jgi:hypothetical protein
MILSNAYCCTAAHIQQNRCLKRVDEPSGKAAVIWMIGEYGHYQHSVVDAAPYMLEPLIGKSFKMYAYCMHYTLHYTVLRDCAYSRV